VRTSKSSSSNITTNNGYTQHWAIAPRRSLSYEPSAKVGLQIRRERRSLLLLTRLNPLQGCWRNHRDGFMNGDCANDGLSQQRGSTNEELRVCQPSLSQPRGHPSAVCQLCARFQLFEPSRVGSAVIVCSICRNCMFPSGSVRPFRRTCPKWNKFICFGHYEVGELDR